MKIRYRKTLSDLHLLVDLFRIYQKNPTNASVDWYPGLDDSKLDDIIKNLKLSDGNALKDNISIIMTSLDNKLYANMALNTYLLHIFNLNKYFFFEIRS